MLIFAPNVVLTFPDHLARSDWMYHFIEGYLKKLYGVRRGIEWNAMLGKWVHVGYPTTRQHILLDTKGSEFIDELCEVE